MCVRFRTGARQVSACPRGYRYHASIAEGGQALRLQTAANPSDSQPCPSGKCDQIKEERELVGVMQV
jgi:hypothetical protein